MFQPVHTRIPGVKPGIYAATDKAVRGVASKHVPLNKPWYFVEVYADGSATITKNPSRSISASASDAMALAKAGMSVVDIESFAPGKLESTPSIGGGAVASMGESLKAKLGSSVPALTAKVEVSDSTDGDYAEMSYAELRSLAKKRGLSAGGKAEDLIARLAESDLAPSE